MSLTDSATIAGNGIARATARNERQVLNCGGSSATSSQA